MPERGMQWWLHVSELKTFTELQLLVHNMDDYLIIIQVTGQ